MVCVLAIPVQEGDTCVPVCSLLLPALCRGNATVMSSHHNKEEKWTRGCFITFSSALMSRGGLESKYQLCFGDCKRKSLSLTQNGSLHLGDNGWRWKFQQESKRNSLTHMPRLGPCVRPHATFMSLCVIQITVELYPESGDKEEEESGTWCWWCHCSPRMQSNCVFINRKFLFSQLKMGNKEVLFWNTSLPSFI